jgi:hypothetical protein
MALCACQLIKLFRIDSENVEHDGDKLAREQSRGRLARCGSFSARLQRRLHADLLREMDC